MRISANKSVARHLQPVGKSQRDKNFGLSLQEFVDLQRSLREGDHRLYEQIFLLHFEDCRYYLCIYDGATPEIAYDVVMETMLRFHDLLIAGKVKYGNLRYLFTLMAHQKYVRTIKSTHRFTELLPEFHELPEETVEFSPEEYDLLSRAFRSLGKNCRDILESFYFSRCSLKEIAEQEGREAAAVRKQKSRCVARLRKYFHHLTK